jgi:hypothetical protein
VTKGINFHITEIKYNSSQKDGLGQGQTQKKKKKRKKEADGNFAIRTHCYGFNDLPMLVLLWSRCEVPPTTQKR